MMRFALLLCVVLGTACAPKNRLLGNWDSTITLAGQQVPIIHRFGPDGQHSATFEVAGVKGELSGAYLQEGEKLTVTPHSLKVDTSGSQLPQLLIDQGKAEVEKQLKVPQVGAVTWKSDTEFTVKPENPDVEPMTFKKRVEP